MASKDMDAGSVLEGAVATVARSHGRTLLTLALSILGLAAASIEGPATAAGKRAPKTTYTLGAYPNALCNDGTPGIYFLRKSTTGSTKWLFYLEGGGECSSVSDCATARNTNYYFTTSTGWNGKSSTGILSSDSSVNPAFYDANVVKVHYCSQDYWSGAKVPTTSFLAGNADTGWWFQGRAIAMAALQDLTTNASATNFPAATSVVFSGSSAGGLGIVFTINDLLPLVPFGATVQMAVDAGFTVELGAFDKTQGPTYISTVNPYTTTVNNGLVLWAGRADINCANQAQSQADLANCYNTGMLLNGNYIGVRTFLAQAELDQDQLTQHGWTAAKNVDAPHMTYETEFADASKAQAQSVGPLNQIFAPQRVTHTFFVGDAAFTNPEIFGPDTVTPSAAVASWFASTTQTPGMFGTQAGLQ